MITVEEVCHIKTLTKSLYKWFAVLFIMVAVLLIRHTVDVFFAMTSAIAIGIMIHLYDEISTNKRYLNYGLCIRPIRDIHKYDPTVLESNPLSPLPIRRGLKWMLVTTAPTETKVYHALCKENVTGYDIIYMLSAKEMATAYLSLLDQIKNSTPIYGGELLSVKIFGHRTLLWINPHQLRDSTPHRLRGCCKRKNSKVPHSSFQMYNLYKYAHSKSDIHHFIKMDQSGSSDPIYNVTLNGDSFLHMTSKMTPKHHIRK